MTPPNRGPDKPSGNGDTQSDLSGATGDVVQARDVHGGVHFHGTVREPDGPPISTPRQLPSDVRGFVNREAELARLDRLLTDDPEEPLVVGLSVIAGTAGVGKTSLVLRWAHRAQARFPDGQLYANLQGYDVGPPLTPERVLDHFLHALGMPPNAVPFELDAKAAAYRSTLAGRRVLVVLDNAVNEHQVRPLLPGTVGSLAIVTSRGRLSGLTVREGARRITVDVLTEAEAVRLIRSVTDEQRADDDADELAELARSCARLPLALRIAAERAGSRPHMRLRELIEDLRDESNLWDALATGDDENADAVRVVFAWSYRALTADAARLFRLLGLHPGPDFSTEAAAALAGTIVSRVRHLLDNLVGAHLLEQPAAGRHQFHDLLRAYATDQAHGDETPEACQAAVERCVTWYLHTADAAQAAIEPSQPRVALDPLEPGLTLLEFTQRTEAMAWFAAEQDNLVAAVRAAGTHGMDRMAWQLPIVLRSYYSSASPFQDWQTTGRLGIEAARRLREPHAEAESHENLGMAYSQSGQPDDAAGHYAAALVLRRELGDRFGEALALNRLGVTHLRSRRLGAALNEFTQGREVFRELGHAFWIAQLTASLGDVSVEFGDLHRAGDLIEEALPTFRALRERGSEGDALVSLSRVRREQGQPAEALVHVTEAHRRRPRTRQSRRGSVLAAGTRGRAACLGAGVRGAGLMPPVRGDAPTDRRPRARGPRLGWYRRGLSGPRSSGRRGPVSPAGRRRPPGSRREMAQRHRPGPPRHGPARGRTPRRRQTPLAACVGAAPGYDDPRAARLRARISIALAGADTPSDVGPNGADEG